MSELLRAVLDKSCIYSNPFFYTSEITYGPVATTQVQSDIVEIKSDKYFLITSLCFSSIGPSAAGQNNNGLNAGIDISLLRSSRRILQIPVHMFMLGNNERCVHTLPEYILCEPNDTIMLTTTPYANVSNNLISLTYNGIEYGK